MRARVDLLSFPLTFLVSFSLSPSGPFAYIVSLGVAISNLNREIESLTSENERLVGRLDDAANEREEIIEKHASEIKVVEVPSPPSPKKNIA